MATKSHEEFVNDIITKTRDRSSDASICLRRCIIDIDDTSHVVHFAKPNVIEYIGNDFCYTGNGMKHTMRYILIAHCIAKFNFHATDENINFGATLKELSNKMKSKGIEKIFERMIHPNRNNKIEQYFRLIYKLCEMCYRNNISVNYTKLLKDILYWSNPEWHDDIVLRWSKSFYSNS